MVELGFGSWSHYELAHNKSYMFTRWELRLAIQNFIFDQSTKLSFLIIFTSISSG